MFLKHRPKFFLLGEVVVRFGDLSHFRQVIADHRLRVSHGVDVEKDTTTHLSFPPPIPPNSFFQSFLVSSLPFEGGSVQPLSR